MIFLKQIKAKCFKSFAHETIIDFNHGMTAIIGPNGSGKSNIVDAIKWTIGEQSNKQLRGKDKHNLIFAGTDTLPPAEEAYVEITFNNEDNFFDIDSKEVKVKRFSRPKDDESLYFINDKPAKLREIQELFLDSGLTKGNLGIISQGTVSEFSEAKPEDRKQIFHEAAGIGKYDKRKKESLNSLAKAEEVFRYIQGELAIIDKERKNLLKIQEKAQEYATKSAELKQLELYVSNKKHKILKTEIETYENDDNRVKKDLDSIEAKLSLENELLNSYNIQINELDTKINELEIEDNNLKAKFEELNNQLNAIQMKINNDMMSGNIEDRIAAYRNMVKQNETDLELHTKQLNNLLKNKVDLDQNFHDSKQKYDNLINQITTIDRELYSFKNQKEQLENQKARSIDKTVDTLLKNKSALPGLIDTVGNLIKVNKEYEKAIYTGLGGAVKHFVTIDEKSALNTINFLKTNKNGSSTFLPLDKIVSREMDNQLIGAIKHLKGFIDIASNLVKIDKEYKIVANHLLGNIVIVDNLENATKIATQLKQKFKVITLEGDVKNPGGSITGGHKLQTFIINFDDEIKVIEDKIQHHDNLLKNLKSQQISFDTNLNQITNKINFNASQIDLHNSKIEQYKIDIKKFNDELKAIDCATSKNLKTDDNTLSKLQTDISQIKFNRDKILNEKNSLHETKNQIISKKSITDKNINDYNLQINKYNQDIQIFTQKLLELKNNFDQIQHYIVEQYNIDLNAIDPDEYSVSPFPHLSDNQMLNQISILKNELKKIGYINDSYLDDLKAIEEKFATIETEYNQALEAVDKIKLSIDELDKKAKKDFKDTIKKINDFLPEVFKKFFGGGQCKIELTDPNNVLESGVEISVQPPGKNIVNLFLLSGGEKTLVSLTVLFSILKVSHFPLIILDEAEAALDEGNVHLFASMIKEFSTNNQFIIITHRPGTMEIADVLLGVTMENRGISRILKTSYEEINNKG